MPPMHEPMPVASGMMPTAPLPPVQPAPVAAPVPRPEGVSRRRERYVADPSEQPEFLRRPVKRTRRDAAPATDEVTVAPPIIIGDDPTSRD